MSCDVGEVTESLEISEQSSFSKLCHFTYVTVHSDSPTFPSLHLCHSSFSNPSLALPTSQSSAHSPCFPSLHLRHNSFSNSSLALPTSQIILQTFRCFTYITAHSPTLLSLQDFHLRHLASRP